MSILIRQMIVAITKMGRGVIRKYSLLIIFILTAQCASASQTGTAKKVIYLLRNDETKEWCGFATESPWRAAIALTNPDITGGVEFKNDRIASVQLSTTDFTADWSVYDNYAVNNDGTLQRLTRDISFQNEKVREEWGFVGGKAVRRKPPVSQPAETQFRMPVITSLEAFPFWFLVKNHQREIFTKGKVCTPAKQ